MDPSPPRGKHLPASWDALQVELTAIVEREARSRDEVGDKVHRGPTPLSDPRGLPGLRLTDAVPYRGVDLQRVIIGSQADPLEGS